MKKIWKHFPERSDELEAFYRSLIPTIRKVARECGYAIGVHGTLRRDLDLIAAPWIPKALAPETLALRIEKAVCKYRFIRTYPKMKAEGESGERKPHGRIAYVITTGPHSYIDLSVMPRGQKKA